MPSEQDTAYPRFKKKISRKELSRIYTPTSEEIKFARKSTRGSNSTLYFLIKMKTFRRLGYFVPINDIPKKIIRHIANKLNIGKIPNLIKIDTSGSSNRYAEKIRDYYSITPFDDKGREIAVRAIHEASRTKEDLPDIINVCIEELVRHKYELPAFSTLQRLAFAGRARINEQLYSEINNCLDDRFKNNIRDLFLVKEGETKSSWHYLKSEPKKLTITNLKERIEYVQWISKQFEIIEALNKIPEIKIKQFSSEAMSLNAARMDELADDKKYAIAVALIFTQLAKGYDDLAEMFIKIVSKSHTNARNALKNVREKNEERTDQLIDTLHKILIASSEQDNSVDFADSVQKIIEGREENLLKACEEHAVYAGNNYIPFIWRFHSSKRKAMFDILETISLISTTQDNALIKAIKFLMEYKGSRKNNISILKTDSKNNDLAFDLSCIPESWEKAVFGKKNKSGITEVDRHNFELCIFHQIKEGLKTGDLCIEGSDSFSDYRVHLIEWEEFKKLLIVYGEMVNLPVDTNKFVDHIKKKLETLINKVDKSFPKNEFVRMENGLPVIKKKKRNPDPPGLKDLEALIADHLKPVNIPEILYFTQKWLNWDKHFGPLSGFSSKLKDPVLNYIATVFCYGCNLGPVQASKSIKDVNRFQLSWVNQRHINEEKLNEVITDFINAYNKYDLPKYWGSGKSASVDGTKWDTYEQNLMAEYHIRYGGYGGIGYYHVSDTYIALFSHFIPCGVYEATYLLDGLLKNLSDIQPDTVHGDTHSQSETVFGLSYLLGIELMPRIRRWKKLTFYRSEKDHRYENIDSLFTGTIDWELIRKYFYDMLRVAISVKEGRITASAILRRLGTYSRKNKLYKAFRELGRVIRTIFLINYIDNAELRETIQAATCKSETFNKYANWLLFGGEGVISENNRDEQRKIIKYNHLVANALSLYNVQAMTSALNEIEANGHAYDKTLLPFLSPYLTAHVNRFGDFNMSFSSDVPPPEFMLSYANFDKQGMDFSNAGLYENMSLVN